jgi:chorismate synthase
MPALRFLTAGESHGPALGVILEGLPAGIPVSAEAIARDLARRQRGYGRGARMAIEQDRAEILGGVRHGRTLGSPVHLVVRNRDWENWTRVMQVGALSPEEAAELAALIEGGNRRALPVTRVRPGHADLAGALKYGFDDVRNVLERASARETAMRVAAGAVCRALLRELGVEAWSFTAEVGGAAMDPARSTRTREETEESPLRCPDPIGEAAMIARIDEARSRGDTVGGVFEVVATGVPVGLGSHVHWDRRLDGRLAGAVCSIHAVKGVEFGLGFEQTRRLGSEVHDIIEGIGEDSAGRHGGTGGPGGPGGPGGEEPLRRWLHRTNRAGGLTGGISNGEPIVVRGAVKPISTLARPLPSADLLTGEPVETAHYERSDISVVPAAGVIGEAMVLLVLADAVLEKFGGDSLDEIRDSVARSRGRMTRGSARTGGAPPPVPGAGPPDGGIEPSGNGGDG